MKKIPVCFMLLLALGVYAPVSYALEVNSNVTTETSLDTRLTGSATAADTNLSSNSSTNVNVEESIKVERKDDDSNGSPVTIINATSVNSSADLKVYGRSILSTYPNVISVAFDKESVTLDYQKEGKVLGIFKVKYNVITKVNKDGKIEVNYPWFAALIRNSNKPQVRQRMETEVTTFLDRNTNATGEIELNAQVEAKLVNLIHIILSEELNAGTSTNSASTTTASMNGNL